MSLAGQVLLDEGTENCFCPVEGVLGLASRESGCCEAWYVCNQRPVTACGRGLAFEQLFFLKLPKSARRDRVGSHKHSHLL